MAQGHQQEDEHEAEPYYGDDASDQQQPAQPFGAPGTAIAKGETAVSAIATQAKAMVEARYLMALHRPRDLDVVRVKLLKDCKRPGFAESARYRRPAGRKFNERTRQWEEQIIEGPSIRFAESAIRSMGNIDVQSPTLYDDDDQRIVRVLVTDLESNATYSRDITIEKTVERKKLKKGQKARGSRLNSYGEPVYIVGATESEVETKQAAAISKAIRTLGLRLLPGDILEECMEECIATRDAKIKEDPERARKKMIDGFVELGVSPDELKLYAGQDLASLSPVQIGELRDLYLAIKDGVTNWGEVKRARTEGEDEDADSGDSRLEQLKNTVKGHADEVKRRKAGIPSEPQKPASEPK